MMADDYVEYILNVKIPFYRVHYFTMLQGLLVVDGDVHDHYSDEEWAAFMVFLLDQLQECRGKDEYKDIMLNVIKWAAKCIERTEGE